jgi:hypothetical protein
VLHIANGSVRNGITVFWTFCQSSGILKTREHNISIRKLDLLPSSGLRLATSKTQQRRRLLLHLRAETDPVSETLCSLVFRILEDGQNPKMQ